MTGGSACATSRCCGVPRQLQAPAAAAVARVAPTPAWSPVAQTEGSSSDSSSEEEWPDSPHVKLLQGTLAAHATQPQQPHVLTKLDVSHCKQFERRHQNVRVELTPLQVNTNLHWNMFGIPVVGHCKHTEACLPFGIYPHGKHETRISNLQAQRTDSAQSVTCYYSCTSSMWQLFADKETYTRVVSGERSTMLHVNAEELTTPKDAYKPWPHPLTRTLFDIGTAAKKGFCPDSENSIDTPRGQLMHQVQRMQRETFTGNAKHAYHGGQNFNTHASYEYFSRLDPPANQKSPQGIYNLQRSLAQNTTQVFLLDGSLGNTSSSLDVAAAEYWASTLASGTDKPFRVRGPLRASAKCNENRAAARLGFTGN